MRIIDLTGEKFGKLTVINRAPDKVLPSGYKQVMWNCNCECGNTSVVSSKALKNAKYPTRSCGCNMNQIKNNLVGQRFGRLTVTEKVKGKILKSGYEQQTYKCVCDCGNEVTLPYSSLTTGNTTSCGCYFKEELIKRNTTHGKSKTKLYDVWREMRRRCSKEKDLSYQYYGARGISVCDEWDSNYENFYNWAIKSGYSEGLEIDRIDVDGDYSPSNCRWVTRKEQMNNISRNRYVTIRKNTKTLSQWGELFNINPQTLWSRLCNGWDSITALTAPIGYKFKKKGKYQDGEELFSNIIRC